MMEVQGFVLLCALATACCSASATRIIHGAYWLAGLLAGVVLVNPAWLALPLTPVLAIEPAHVSLLIFLLAFVCIRRSVSARVVVTSGGLIAALWLQAMTSTGYPLPIALLLIMAASLIALLGRLYRPGFCTSEMLEEAFTIVMAFALLLALVPEALKGWHAALGLQGVDHTAPVLQESTGMLLIAGSFVVLGVLYAKWKYR